MTSEIPISQKYKNLLAESVQRSIVAYKARYSGVINPTPLVALGQATEAWRSIRGRSHTIKDSSKVMRLDTPERTLLQAEAVFNLTSGRYPYTVFAIRANTPSGIRVNEEAVESDLSQNNLLLDYGKMFASMPSLRTNRSKKPSIEVALLTPEEAYRERRGLPNDAARIRFAWDERRGKVLVTGRSLTHTGRVPEVRSGAYTQQLTVVDFAKRRKAIIDEVLLPY